MGTSLRAYSRDTGCARPPRSKASTKPLTRFPVRPFQHGSWPKRDREKAFTANRGAACRPPTRMKHRGFPGGFPRASAHCRAREKAVGTGPGKCYTVRRTVLASTYRERIRHFDFHCCRLGRHRWLSAGHAGSRFVFPEPLGEKHGRLLRLGPQRFLVVGGDFHGGDTVCRGHAASGHWPRLQKRHRRQLVLVELFAFGHDDRVSLCAVVAPLWAPDRRAVRGNALLGKARRILAGLSSALSRLADELPDPRMGHKSHDRYRGRQPGNQRSNLAVGLRLLPDS